MEEDFFTIEFSNGHASTSVLISVFWFLSLNHPTIFPFFMAFSLFLLSSEEFNNLKYWLVVRELNKLSYFVLLGKNDKFLLHGRLDVNNVLILIYFLRVGFNYGKPTKFYIDNVEYFTENCIPVSGAHFGLIIVRCCRIPSNQVGMITF